jgi:HAD superfamily hydrolase (TIGR01509 family)
MNIIIPLAGKGERFKKEGYDKPKCLINIYEKTMIEYVIDHLLLNINIDKQEEYNFFIFYRNDLNEYNFYEFINLKYPFINLIKVPETKGASETLLLGIESLIKNNFKLFSKTLVVDCDTFYTENIIDIFKNTSENLIFYTNKENEKPIYSYIQLNENKYVLNIAEKNKISNNANTGAYGFKNIEDLYKYCRFVIDNNINFNNEPYTSCVIHKMICDNNIFYGYELDNDKVFVVGTPKELNDYLEKSYAFLFDLDGTIVLTDDIYFEVWYQILSNYNISLDKEMFHNFIQGNSDQNIIENIFRLPMTLNEFSDLKDKTFIEKCNDNIKIVEGILDFIKSLYNNGHKICIVSNSNKFIIEFIIQKLNIKKYIDFYICSQDCIGKTKPNSYPYLYAIKKYNIENKKCIIFEDSKSGILSGLSVNPKMLIGIETLYSGEELLNLGVNYSIKNYNNLNLDFLLYYNNDSFYTIKKMIKNAFFKDEIVINLNTNNLKGGFIASVISFKTEENNIIKNYVLKYENNQTNNLSSMAKNLQLYQREYYFYEKIANFIRSSIKIPEYINTIYDEEFNPKGIILENLFESNKNLKINIDLNKVKIEISLKIIDRMSKMHSIFWNKNLTKIFPELPNSRNKIFYPFFNEFLNEKYHIFYNKWKHVLNEKQMKIFNNIYENFDKIQNELSQKHLTFIHGDIKSPNLFYDESNNYEPYFLDWQHCAIGKGTQDLIFFLIESFDIKNLKLYFNLFKYYYYQKLIEYGINNYSWEEYEKDILNAIYYVPFFTAVWFGSLSYDELIDKNWPYFFIQKYAYLLENINC